MWCSHCQAEVAVELSGDNRRVLCAACGQSLGEPKGEVRGFSLLDEATRSARQLLQRWSTETSLDLFDTAPRPTSPSTRPSGGQAADLSDACSSSHSNARRDSSSESQPAKKNEDERPTSLLADDSPSGSDSRSPTADVRPTDACPTALVGRERRSDDAQSVPGRSGQTKPDNSANPTDSASGSDQPSGPGSADEQRPQQTRPRREPSSSSSALSEAPEAAPSASSPCPTDASSVARRGPTAAGETERSSPTESEATADLPEPLSPTGTSVGEPVHAAAAGEPSHRPSSPGAETGPQPVAGASSAVGADADPYRSAPHFAVSPRVATHAAGAVDAPSASDAADKQAQPGTPTNRSDGSRAAANWLDGHAAAPSPLDGQAATPRQTGGQPVQPAQLDGRPQHATPHARLDQPHQHAQPPHVDVPGSSSDEADQQSSVLVWAGQLLAYLGVLGLTAGSCLVLWSYFGGPVHYAPTGWLVTTASQMLLFLGVVTLISGGLEQTTRVLTRRIDRLGERILRFEQAERQPMGRGPVTPPSAFLQQPGRSGAESPVESRLSTRTSTVSARSLTPKA